MADKREADKLGGSDNKSDYAKRDNEKYCDKFNHAERSRHNDTGQHDKHWQKVEKEDSKNGRTNLS